MYSIFRRLRRMCQRPGQIDRALIGQKSDPGAAGMFPSSHTRCLPTNNRVKDVLCQQPALRSLSRLVQDFSCLPALALDSAKGTHAYFVWDHYFNGCVDGGINIYRRLSMQSVAPLDLDTRKLPWSCKTPCFSSIRLKES
jgi:hypothetical protein